MFKCGELCQKFWLFFNNAFKYKLIQGALIVKVVQALFQITGTNPWPVEQDKAVETLIDFCVGILCVMGVGQAHSTDPGKDK